LVVQPGKNIHSAPAPAVQPVRVPDMEPAVEVGVTPPTGEPSRLLAAIDIDVLELTPP
jgi:hypothetical protein